MEYQDKIVLITGAASGIGAAAALAFAEQGAQVIVRTVTPKEEKQRLKPFEKTQGKADFMA